MYICNIKRKPHLQLTYLMKILIYGRKEENFSGGRGVGEGVGSGWVGGWGVGSVIRVPLLSMGFR